MNIFKRIPEIAAVVLFIAFVFSCKGPETCGPVSIGDTAPDFTYKDIDGKTVSLSEFRGKVVLVEFWATWCSPCRIITPVLNDLYKQYKDKGFVILALAQKDEGTETIRSFVKENKMQYPVLLSDRNVITCYNVTGIPVTFLIDRDGKIASKHIGYSHEMMFELPNQILKLL